MISKTCSKCHIEKPLSEYHKDSRLKGGLRSSCKACHTAQVRASFHENKEYHHQKNKEWREANKEHNRARFLEWRNRPENKDRDKRYYQANKEARKAISKRWRDNPENKSRIREASRIRSAHLRATSPLYNLRIALRSRVITAIKKGYACKSAKTFELIGCTIQELMKHLESLFQPGMDWGNYGRKGWHIDHIMPVSSFDLTIPEQQRKCFHYTNLQPLWWYDNLAKGNKKPDTVSSIGVVKACEPTSSTPLPQ